MANPAPGLFRSHTFWGRMYVAGRIPNSCPSIPASRQAANRRAGWLRRSVPEQGEWARTECRQPCCTGSTIDSHASKAIQRLLSNNRKWAQIKAIEDPDFFSRSAKGQMPEFLWIGCSDSRVVTNFITGLEPGDIFTHRNVGNIVAHGDLNCMSVVEYAVLSLKVKHVIVCGHYGCGACTAAVTMPRGTPGMVNSWISRIRDVKDEWREELEGMEETDQIRRLCELNAAHQTFSMSTSPPVQAAWEQGQELYVHGMVYDLCDGRLTSLVGPISSAEEAVDAQKLFMETKGAAVSARGNGAAVLRELAGR